MIVDSLDKDEYRKFLKSIIIKGQECQRNWDLSKQIPKEDLDVIIYAATQAPSKQNIDFYSLLVIQNREIQEKIYNNTWTIPGSTIGRFNPQVLANVLLIFVFKKHSDNYRNQESLYKNELQLEVDRNQAIGVSAGFANIVAQSLGYSTAFNKCFDLIKVKEILNIKENPILMMGVGFKDTNRNRREEHVTGHMIGSFPKLPIPVEYID